MADIKLTTKEKIEDLVSIERQQGKTQQQIEKEIGLASGTLSKIFGEQTKNVSVDTILKIANHYNVSTDYLLKPECNIKSPNATIQAISEFTGLSEEVIHSLNMSKNISDSKFPFDIYSQFDDFSYDDAMRIVFNRDVVFHLVSIANRTIVRDKELINHFRDSANRVVNELSAVDFAEAYFEQQLPSKLDDYKKGMDIEPYIEEIAAFKENIYDNAYDKLYEFNKEKSELEEFHFEKTISLIKRAISKHFHSISDEAFESISKKVLADIWKETSYSKEEDYGEEY